jgi:hypothetical protein
MVKAVFGFLSVLGGAFCGWMLFLAVENITQENPLEEIPPCFELGEPFHHRFRPNCVGLLRTPRGEVQLSVNEDGLREIARPHVLKQPKRILVMGDSFVEGWWAAQDEGISSLLGQRFPAYYFINAGLRSTGPVMQASRLREAVGRYEPSAVIWLLNDTDPLDDRFACAIADGKGGFGIPELELEGWRKSAVALLELGPAASARRLRRRFYQEKWQSLALGESGGACEPCRGVKELVRAAAGLPIFVLYLPIYSGLPMRQYASGHPAKQQIFSCLEEAGLKAEMALPEGLSREEIERYTWEKDFHLNPEGMAYLVDFVSQGSLPDFLRRNAGPRPKRKSPAAR